MTTIDQTYKVLARMYEQEKYLGNSQEYEPALFVQNSVELHKCCPVVHSSISWHTVPFPLYPLLHAHEYEPIVFEHAAFASHEWWCRVHSFMSWHTVPFP